MKKLAKKLIEKTKDMILSCVHFTQACYFVACNLKSYYKISDYLHALWYVIQILLFKKKYIPFAKGNNKLQKNILIFDMPEVMTCACACANCYAQKASRLYRNTRRKRLVNFMLADFASRNRQAKAWLFCLFNNMVEKHVTYCKKNKIMPILRLHSAGDIYHVRYENLLIEYTMQANKSLVIYTYTKKLSHEKIDIYNSSFVHKINYIVSGQLILNIVRTFRITALTHSQRESLACISPSSTPFTRQAL